MKNLLWLMAIPPLILAEPVFLEKTPENCCTPKATFLQFESSESVDGISFIGILSPSSVGDMGGYTTGKALITFVRDVDDKSFTVSADRLGFFPGNEFTSNFINGSEGRYEITRPIRIAPSLIKIQDSILKVTCLFCHARGYGNQKVYKIINTDEKFDYEYLYTFPDNAKWNPDGSFTYDHVMGGAMIGGETTVGQIKQNRWIVLRKTEYSSWSDDTYNREWQFNEDTMSLELIKDE